jgi:hypothetical protein
MGMHAILGLVGEQAESNNVVSGDSRSGWSSSLCGGGLVTADVKAAVDAALGWTPAGS